MLSTRSIIAKLSEALCGTPCKSRGVIAMSRGKRLIFPYCHGTREIVTEHPVFGPEVIPCDCETMEDVEHLDGMYDDRERECE
jgi:hypothetical protein